MLVFSSFTPLTRIWKAATVRYYVKCYEISVLTFRILWCTGSSEYEATWLTWKVRNVDGGIFLLGAVVRDVWIINTSLFFGVYRRSAKCQNLYISILTKIKYRIYLLNPWEWNIRCFITLPMASRFIAKNWRLSISKKTKIKYLRKNAKAARTINNNWII